jgi:uncharacterized repeat protein (TIGR01451 family)
MKKIIFLLCIAFLYTGTVTAQYKKTSQKKGQTSSGSITEKTTRATWTHYHPGAYISDAYADLSGNVWFGTSMGLLKYDGASWTIYNTSNSGICANDITSVTCDLTGKIWAGSFGGGLSSFDGQNWQNYNSSNSPLPNNIISELGMDPSGNLYIVSFGSVTIFDGSVFTPITIPGLLSCIFIDNNGNVYIGTGDNSDGVGVIKYDGVGFSNINTTNSGLPADGSTDITADAAGNIWICTTDGLAMFDGSQWVVYNINNSNLIHNFANKIAFDNNGVLWIGTTNGISVFDGLTWTNFDESDYNVNQDRFTGVAIDIHGNKWFSTHEGGILRYSDNGPGPQHNFSIISGTVYNDSNQNNIFDAGETAVGNQMIRIDPPLQYTTSNNNGKFYFTRPAGNYTLSLIPDPYWNLSGSNPLSFAIPGNTVTDTLNFGIYPAQDIFDAAIYCSGNSPRIASTAVYWLNYKNKGTVPLSGSFSMTYDPVLLFQTSDAVPDQHTGNTLTWNYTALQPGENHMIFLTFDVPSDVNLIGDSIFAYCQISTSPGDMFMADNADTLMQVITGAYDPNDKTAHPAGLTNQGFILHNQEIQYTIRFQNTGNDTAYQVVIKDTLNLNMDIESFTLLASSHNVTYSITGTNIITFAFSNIMLPDSFINPAASQGFVRYSVMPEPGLADYTVVTNTAAIYFDFNPPILTNTVVNTYVSDLPTGTNPAGVNKQAFIYPNPSAGAFHLAHYNDVQLIEVFNVHNKRISSSRIIREEYSSKIDLTGLPAGMYYVRIWSNSAAEIHKIVKQ